MYNESEVYKICTNRILLELFVNWMIYYSTNNGKISLNTSIHLLSIIIHAIVKIYNRVTGSNNNNNELLLWNVLELNILEAAASSNNNNNNFGP